MPIAANLIGTRIAAITPDVFGLAVPLRDAPLEIVDPIGGPFMSGSGCNLGKVLEFAVLNT